MDGGESGELDQCGEWREWHREWAGDLSGAGEPEPDESDRGDHGQWAVLHHQSVRQNIRDGLYDAKRLRFKKIFLFAKSSLPV